MCKEEMPSVMGAKHQPSPGLLGAALQPATPEVMVGISSSSLSSSVAGNGSAAEVLGTGELPFPSWAAQSSRVAGTILSLTLALPLPAALVV